MLDNKSCKAIFLGVNEESKAYKMYNFNSKKIIISRDVLFEENSTWDWGSNEDHVNTTSNVLTGENYGQTTQEEPFPEIENIAPKKGHEEQGRKYRTNRRA